MDRGLCLLHGERVGWSVGVECVDGVWGWSVWIECGGGLYKNILPSVHVDE